MSYGHINRSAPAGGTITSMPLRAQVITPSDTTVYETGVTVYVGGEGAVVVEPYLGGNEVTFAMAGGAVVPVVCRRVLAASTATDLVGVW